MDFTFHHIGFANLLTNGHNYLTFSIMGLLIVFAGLSFISLYIALLPKILNLSQILQSRRARKEDQSQDRANADTESELLLAIAVALHLDQTGSPDHEKITWQRHDELESPWLTAGRMRGLDRRSHLPGPRN